MAKRQKRNTRQRMINLMYLVFIAMLAINISDEVLDGFDLINENLNRTLENTNKRKNKIYEDIAYSYEIAPEKTAEVYKKAEDIKQKTDSLFNRIQTLKQRIADKTDGKGADAQNIDKKGDLSASSVVMLDPSHKEGEKLRKEIETYREHIITLIGDTIQREIVKKSLATEASKKRKLNIDNPNWEQAAFEGMPAIAAITYLTELQVNVRQAEGEVLNTIAKEMDIKDLRVNEVSAFVIPQSNIVMRGTNYTADIIMAAVDTTQRPRIVVNGKELPAENKGQFTIGTGSVGKQKLTGFISLMSRDGQEIKRTFEKEYTVIEPMVTIAPLLMDVLYANYSNPISVSVPGVPTQDITVSGTGGSIRKEGANWVATPSKAGQDMTINVSFKVEGGRSQTLSKKFRVRQLPDPVAYIQYTDANGNLKMFKNGALPRTTLLNAGGLKAAIDDGVLNIPFQILGFRTMSIDAMGNASPEVSAGANFSPRQLDQIKRMQRGRELIVVSIRVKGPDGSEREISPMQIRLN